MKKDMKEIIDFIEDNISDLDPDPECGELFEDDIFKNFKVALADSYGGEGKGEEYWYVAKLIDKESDEEFFIKMDGYYQSYEGTSWDSATVNLVKPYEKTVKSWKTVK